MASDQPAETEELRRRLKAAHAQARRNEQILRRYQELELRLISAPGFREFAGHLLHGYKKIAALDAVTLALYDPEYEIRRMLYDLDLALADFPELLFLDRLDELALSLGAATSPVLCRYDAARHAALFPAGAAPAGVALLPLLRRKKLIGSLNLGSAAEDRFVAGMATDFLERLAAVTAICLENVVNGERLRHLGLTDPLTGVHNRRYFEERLHQETGLAQRQGQPLSCLLLDLDHFKRINDSYGHPAGDCVLREAALRIKEQLRLSDTLARYGGEEFAVLLAQTDETAAFSIAERIRASIATQPFALPGGKSLSATTSVGIASLRDNGRAESAGAAAQRLVAQADQALYRAKQAGRNCIAGNPRQGQLALDAELLSG